ncbi:MAG TPA: GMC family oxidoreductase [Longimicrobiales bacterium]|nr:GMC family oxidoreductase [Longimicrobiales bacterium]
MRRQVRETDVLVIGGGITAAMIAEKLTDEHDVDVTILEAGRPTVPIEARQERRRRYMEYGENPWTDDHIEDQSAQGIMSRSMGVGGQAMHWGGATPRYSPEDFRLRSLFGVHEDWPVDYETLDPYYQEAEERIGVAGEQGPEPLDPRGAPYPMPAVPLTWTLERLRAWMDTAGIPTWPNPVAKNTTPWRGRNVCQRCDTCNICPTGAKYTPEFTFASLAAANRARMETGVLVRRLALEPASDRILAAHARAYGDPDTELIYRARTFVLAAGYTWSPHLLLLSAQGRFPDGLANSSGTLGCFMNGHRSVSAFVELPMRLLPGMNFGHSLVSKLFQRPLATGSRGLSGGRYVRHDFRVWESTTARGPRLRDDADNLLLGDALLADWRVRTSTGTARLRCYYDVIPDRASRVVLDASTRNRFGDPLPRLEFRDAPVSRELRAHTEDRIRALFDEVTRAGSGRLLRTAVDDVQDHPGGGCRMGDDPATSVVDSWGRAHDHENLFVVGAPTLVSGGCNNGTLTFSALSLRAAEEIGREFPARG